MLQGQAGRGVGTISPWCLSAMSPVGVWSRSVVFGSPPLIRLLARVGEKWTATAVRSHDGDHPARTAHLPANSRNPATFSQIRGHSFLQSRMELRRYSGDRRLAVARRSRRPRLRCLPRWLPPKPPTLRLPGPESTGVPVPVSWTSGRLKHQAALPVVSGLRRHASRCSASPPRIQRRHRPPQAQLRPHRRMVTPARAAPLVMVSAADHLEVS